MNQTTAHLAALARALGGYPSPALCREHLIPMRALSPTVARSVQHVSDPLRSVLAGAPLSVTGGSPLASRQVAALVVTPCANSTPGGHGRLTAQPANPSLSPSALCLPAFFRALTMGVFMGLWHKIKRLLTGKRKPIPHAHARVEMACADVDSVERTMPPSVQKFQRLHK